MAIDKSKNVQILITIPLELLNQIETYWHQQKLRSRSEGIRELLVRSLVCESHRDLVKSKENG